MKYFPEEFPPNLLDPVESRRLEYYFETFVMRHFDRYGFGHWALACYASLPAVLTPDLVNKLWLNFKEYRLHDDRLTIHPVAPSDLLLSPLVEEIGYELYEMVEPVRHALLNFLQKQSAKGKDNHLQFAPLAEVAQFLFEYARQERSSGNTNDDALREAQEWTAQSYLNPSKAFKRVAQAFEAAADDPSRQLRYRDAIEKMATRFELGILKPGESAPGGYEAMRILAKIIRNDILKREQQPETYLELSDYADYLSEKPDGDETAITIKIQAAIEEKVNSLGKVKEQRKVRALVVGVGETQEERLSVQEGEQEAGIFADCLKELILPVNLDIQVLTGKAATKKAILDAWGAMVDGAKAQDDLLFYISSNSTLIDDNHCLVVCYDTLSNSMDTSSWLSDSDFEEISRRAVASSITAVLAVNHAATPHWLDQSDDRNVVFATCKQDQVPQLIKSKIAGDGIYYSFTYALVKALQETKLLASNRSVFIQALQYFEGFEAVKNTYGSQLLEKHSPQIIASPAALTCFFLNENKSLVSLQNRLRNTGFYHNSSSGIWDASTATATKAAKKHLQIKEELSKQALARQLESLKERQEEEQKPIFLFVFGDLPAVKREKIAVLTILRKALEGAHAELLVLDNPTKEEFAKAFSRKDRRNRVHWFHFAGLERDSISRLDAPTGFMLKDGLFNLNEFLHLLEFQENIRLAFLNTCFSVPLAEWLTRLGVQAAIGATGFLNDDFAADFSEHFYQGLANGKGIKEAIDGYKSGKDYGSIYRIGIKPEGTDSKKNNINLFTAPWALKDILEWRLASYHLKSSTPQIALRLIHENKKNRAKKLDLGNCGLREIPAEVFELEWLEELILSNLRYEYEPQRGEWVKIFSRNEGGRNRLSKISREISKLQNLRKLVIGGAKGEKWEIASLRPLSTLSNLQYLDIVGNRISNLAPLKGLLKLVVLDISDNLIQTLEALKGLSNLAMLGARFNQVKSLEPLRHLTKLTHLDVGFNHLYFLDGVENLLELREILAPQNLLATIEAVSGLDKLEVLKVWDNELTSLEPLENLPSLAVVHVHRNKIGSLEPLLPLLKKGMRISWDWNKESQIVVGENPVEVPPIEVIKEGKDAVIRYLIKKTESKNIKRGISGFEIDTNDPASKQRRNRLLLIGIDDYEHWDKLQYPVKDCDEFFQVLKAHYGFQEHDLIQALYNEQATADIIFDELYSLRVSDEDGKPRLSADDNLILYFSGHGHLDKSLDEGYWAPVDAPVPVKNRPSDLRKLVSVNEVVRILSQVKAHHILLIVDACFSGAFTHMAVEVMPSDDFIDPEEKPSRWVLTAGALEPNPEKSEFAEALCHILSENDRPKLSIQTLGAAIKDRVADSSRHTPACISLVEKKYEGGEFFFHRRTAVQRSDHATHPAAAIAKLPERLRQGSAAHLERLKKGRFKYLHIVKLLLAGYNLPDLDNNQLKSGDTEPSLQLVMQSLWGKEKPHAVVQGDGGMGKTVSLIRLWEDMLGQTAVGSWQSAVPVFVALNVYNAVPESEKHDFLLRSIALNCGLAEALTDDWKNFIWDLLKTPLPDGSPSVLLMLDGFNEVKVKKDQLLIDLNRLSEQAKGMQMVITSRYVEIQNFTWAQHSEVLELLPLPPVKIAEYLQQVNLPLPEDEKLQKLFGNPMILTLYAGQSDIVKKYMGDKRFHFLPSSLYGELLWNFNEAQLAKYLEDCEHDTDEQAWLIFLVRCLLPFLAYQMEEKGEYFLPIRRALNPNFNFKTLLDEAFTALNREDLTEVFPELEGKGSLLGLGSLSDLDAIQQRFMKVRQDLVEKLNLLVVEGETLRFVHKSYQDFYAAYYLLNEMIFRKISISKVLDEKKNSVHGNILNILNQITPESYKSIIENIEETKLLVWLLADEVNAEQAQEALNLFQPIYFELRRDSPLANYKLEVTPNKIHIFRSVDEFCLRTIVGDDWSAMFLDAFEKLEHIARWEMTLALDNKSGKINSREVELVLVELDAQGKALRKTNQNEVVVDIFRTDGVEQKVPFRLEVHNKNGEKLKYCALFHASENYAFSPVGFNEPVAGSSTAIAMELNPSGAQYELELRGKNEETEIFKLFVSNAALNVEVLQHKGFKLGETVSIWQTRGKTRNEGAISKQRAVFGLDDKEEGDVNDWYTITMQIKCVAREATVGEREVSLAGNFIRILGHPFLRANIGLTSAGRGSRNIESMAVLADLAKVAGVEMLQFGSNSNDMAAPNTIELTDIKHADGLEGNPLQIEVAAGLGDDEFLLPITFDGEHILPVGDVKKTSDGKAIVSISSLPDTVENRRRNLGKALKLCFFKLVLKRETVNELCWVDYQGEDVEHRSENLRDKVLAADNILLLVHGIIGDTKGMAKCMKQAKDSGLFDLVLTYDYENLNTQIQDNAASLKDLLEAAGITPQSGKSITIVAHSMGGLVSRYFIENLNGKAFVKHLVMVGTPNEGSAISELAAHHDLAIVLLGLLILNPWNIPAAATILAILEKSKTPTLSLEQMSLKHNSFLRSLNQSEDPCVRYSVVAGKLHEYLATHQDRKKLMDKLYKLGGKLFYGNIPNDIAVSMESMRAVPMDRNPQPTVVEVACHHLCYFDEGESVEALIKLLQEHA